MPSVAWSESPGTHTCHQTGPWLLAQQCSLAITTYNIQGANWTRLPPAPLSNCTQASLNIAEGRDKISSHFQNTLKLCDAIYLILGKSHRFSHQFSKHPSSSLDQTGGVSTEKGTISHAGFS